MKFIASRLSDGNKVFPSEIHVEATGLTVKIPGFFSGKSRHLDYQQIGEVSVETPLVGYSTITFYTSGTQVSAHGFTKDDVNIIKREIEKGRKGTPNEAKVSSLDDFEKTGDQILAEARAEKIGYEIDKKKKEDNAQKPWLWDSNFENKTSIDKISYPNAVDDIEKTVEKVIKVGIEEVKKVLGEFNTTAIQSTLGNRNFFKPYSDEFEMVESCLEKAKEGIKKLKRFDESDHPKLNHIIRDLEENIEQLTEKWVPKLLEKRAKKKRKNLIVVAVILILNILFWGGLYLKS